MASHNHHHFHPHLHPPPPSSCPCFCTTTTTCSCSSAATCHPPPPLPLPLPPMAATDPLLLQSLVIHLLQSTQNHHHPPPPPPPPQQQHYQYHVPQKQSQPSDPSFQEQAYIDSLIQRIAALESALSAPPPTPPRRESPPPCRRPNRISLRDFAARTIQTQFRIFLVRRSRTLRQLKDLAAVRSDVARLRSPVPPNFSSAVAQKATTLLLHLDSIQSRDPMVREEKRSITGELVGILQKKELSLESLRKMIRAASRLQEHSELTGASSADTAEETEEEVVVSEGGSSRVSEDDEVGKNHPIGSSSSSSYSSLLPPPPAAASNGQQKWIPHLGLYAPLPVQMESRRNG